MTGGQPSAQRMVATFRPRRFPNTPHHLARQGALSQRDARSGGREIDEVLQVRVQANRHRSERCNLKMGKMLGVALPGPRHPEVRTDAD
jgi:hypothetical protein